MKNLIVSSDVTIRDAMMALDKTAEKLLLVVDGNRKLMGTLSDGDLRRSILNGMELTSAIGESYHKEPIVLHEISFTEEEAKKTMLKHTIGLLPIVNEQGQVVKYITWEQVFGDGKSSKKKTLTAPVVIMAGGKGTRLDPFTKVLPKPLVPIRDKPVIEHIIERFSDAGVTDFRITVNYKSRILKAYFEETEAEYSVRFVDETEPLGTAGSLKFLEGEFDKPFFVTNCDVIIDADYADLYAFHIKKGYDISLVASTKRYIIPYGTCVLNGDGHLGHIKEKPEYDFLVNTGLYIVNPQILKFIPKDKVYHITDLIEDVKGQGMKIGVYPISEESWVDVGQWGEFKKALQSFIG